jgi:hypothetical protein
MAANLYPLTYSPGIQRDGTTFQSEYCTDGQWIRFQRGKVKKIGGMRGANTFALLTRVTDLAIFPWANPGESLTFICGELGLYAQINSANWEYIFSKSLLTIGLANPTIMWETEMVVDDNKTYIVFMQNNNAVNINDNSVSTFYVTEVANALTSTAMPNIVQGVKPLINGGLCFSFPFLFVYGSNGLVQYSSSSHRFNFNNENSGQFFISTDKVIFGRPIRGGSNSPTILFWTLSSVVRVTNAVDSNEGVAAQFQSDVISNSSSILSSKCVVEYDGLFFWPGTDRFFVYNGIVQEMDNRLNLNYFFDNIDMERRQQVFGVKNTKYGEIWWFYPVKGTPGANSRAVVYNKRENFWYDTAISRTAGVFSSDFGFMSTYGRSLTNALNTNNYLFKHEVGTNEVILSSPVLQRILGGTPSSNTGLSTDGNGPPNPQNAFVVPPVINTVYIQTPNTNLMYDYGVGNLQTITQIQITNANVDTKANYFCNIQSSLDLINWNQIHVSTQNFIGSQTLTFDIANAQPARAYRLVADPNVATNFLIAFSLNGRITQPVIDRRISSSFTTPIFSWVAFPPKVGKTAYSSQLINRWIDLQRIEPDFVVETSASQFQVVATTREYAQSLNVLSAPVSFVGGTQKVDMRVQGRNMSLTFLSEDAFEVGQIMLLLGIGDAR